MAPMQDTDLIIDGALLREAAQRRLRSWIAFGPGIFLLVAGLMLCVMPQSYTATASVSMQQAQTSTSPLALLTGAGSAGKKYIGILHSRRLAQAAENRFHLRQFYHLPSERKALDLLMENVKPDDSATDGLLFIHVTLTGPPRFASDPNHRGERAKQMAADIANEYVSQLALYYTSSDNDRDTVLLNAAEQELQRVRLEYQQAAANTRAYIVGMRKDSSLTTPSGAGEVTMSAPSGMQTLYDEAERIQAQIRGAEAAQQAQESGMQRQLSALAAIPADDPFLAIARENLSRARIQLNTLQRADLLSDDNPRVVTAREKVRIAQEDLIKQEEGFRKGLTTDRLVAATTLESLRARRDSILDSIRRAESRLPTRRERSIELIELQKAQEIKLAALKATEEKAAELRLSAVPGHSRLSVVDVAIPPDGGTPRMVQIVMLGVTLSILLFFPVLVWDYLRLSRRQRAVATPGNHGAGANTPLDEIGKQPRNGNHNS